MQFYSNRILRYSELVNMYLIFLFHQNNKLKLVLRVMLSNIPRENNYRKKSFQQHDN